jgi:hypothetical protein
VVEEAPDDGDEVVFQSDAGAADDGDDAGEPGEAAERGPEVVRGHVPMAVLVGEQPGAVRAGEVALVGEVERDDGHL